MPQIHGGALDGLSIENLPGPLLAAVVTYLDPHTHQATSAVLAPGCSCHPQDTQSLALTASAARTALRDRGVDPDDAIAAIETVATVDRDVRPGPRRS